MSGEFLTAESLGYQATPTSPAPEPGAVWDPDLEDWMPPGWVIKGEYGPKTEAQTAAEAAAKKAGAPSPGIPLKTKVIVGVGSVVVGGGIVLWLLSRRKG